MGRVSYKNIELDISNLNETSFGHENFIAGVAPFLCTICSSPNSFFSFHAKQS